MVKFSINARLILFTVWYNIKVQWCRERSVCMISVYQPQDWCCPPFVSWLFNHSAYTTSTMQCCAFCHQCAVLSAYLTDAVFMDTYHPYCREQLAIICHCSYGLSVSCSTYNVLSLPDLSISLAFCLLFNSMHEQRISFCLFICWFYQLATQ